MTICSNGSYENATLFSINEYENCSLIGMHVFDEHGGHSQQQDIRNRRWTSYQERRWSCDESRVATVKPCRNAAAVDETYWWSRAREESRSRRARRWCRCVHAGDQRIQDEFKQIHAKLGKRMAASQVTSRTTHSRAPRLKRRRRCPCGSGCAHAADHGRTAWFAVRIAAHG